MTIDYEHLVSGCVPCLRGNICTRCQMGSRRVVPQYALNPISRCSLFSLPNRLTRLVCVQNGTVRKSELPTVRNVRRYERYVLSLEEAFNCTGLYNLCQDRSPNNR